MFLVIVILSFLCTGFSSNQQETEAVDVKIRMASVLYTHSPCLVNELGSCASEFKQYLSNLASSIKSAATEMALGLVHARLDKNKSSSSYFHFMLNPLL